MNILNPLQLAERDGATPELLAIARANALRLKRALESLLDLASIESGVFHARLREIDLHRLLVRAVEGARTEFAELSVKVELGSGSEATVLGDPIKLIRAFEMIGWSAVTRARAGSSLVVQGTPQGWTFVATLDEDKIDEWNEAWSQARAGFDAGVMSPGSAFAGTLDTEQDFLTRTQEGLGSELLLAMEILRMHRGKLEASLKGATLSLSIQLPELATESGLRLALGARLSRVGTEQGSLALVLLSVPEAPVGSSQLGVEDFRRKLKAALFRSTDAAYVLGPTTVALLLDDCRPEDAPKFLLRLGQSLGIRLAFGLACAPRDGFEAGRLIQFAQAALEKRS